ncbi:hypothetical protein CM15mP35_01220 [bacterium]|nr:MAG: hypothetical protein CM15mP35_01220 [bacterium]
MFMYPSGFFNGLSRLLTTEFTTIFSILSLVSPGPNVLSKNISS